MSKRRIVRRIKKEDSRRPYQCNKCNKRYTKQIYLDNHQESYPNCDIPLKCETCERLFDKQSQLDSHLNRKTPCAPSSVPTIEADNPSNTCYKCGNNFSNKSNLKKHEKRCEGKMDNIMKMLQEQKEIDKRERAAEREQFLQILQNQGQSIVPTTNNITNNVQINNNNVQINIVVCGYGQEDLSVLDVQEIKQLVMDNAAEFVPRMIETIHANPEHPKNHNIYFNEEKDQECAMVFLEKNGTMTWQLRDMKVVSKELTTKVKEHVTNNPSINGLFKTADDDEDWERFANGINIIHSIQGDEEEVVEANKAMLIKAKPLCEKRKGVDPQTITEVN